VLRESCVYRPLISTEGLSEKTALASPRKPAYNINDERRMSKNVAEILDLFRKSNEMVRSSSPGEDKEDMRTFLFSGELSLERSMGPGQTYLGIMSKQSYRSIDFTEKILQL